MIQQLLGLLIIAFIVSRQVILYKKQLLAKGEFYFWLLFWLLAAIAIIFIKEIDSLVAKLGFSGSGINVLLYLAVITSFYFIFRMRLRLAKIEKDITQIVREVAIGSQNSDKQER